MILGIAVVALMMASICVGFLIGYRFRHDECYKEGYRVGVAKGLDLLTVSMTAHKIITRTPSPKVLVNIAKSIHDDFEKAQPIEQQRTVETARNVYDNVVSHDFGILEGITKSLDRAHARPSKWKFNK